MRELKFRGLNPDSNKLMDVISISFCENEIMFEEDKGYVFQIDECKIMQFTGLKDKSGVDIYEGDIISFHVDWAGQPIKQVAYSGEFQTYALLSKQEQEWLEKGSNHYKYWKEDEDNVYFLNQCDDYDVEVIGNIHQNPELLKGDQHD